MWWAAAKACGLQPAGAHSGTIIDRQVPESRQRVVTSAQGQPLQWPLLADASAAPALQEWNSNGGNSHNLGVNRFADWTHEEYLRTMLPNHGQPRPQITPDGRSVNVHVPQVAEHMLPSTVDWRGTGAESPIKDQAACGSCWVSSSGWELAARAGGVACCCNVTGLSGSADCQASSSGRRGSYRPCKPLCSALRIGRDQCAEPQAACGFSLVSWVSWGAFAFCKCL